MDISLAEYITYGLIAYTGILVLIVSVIKEVPTTRSLALVRAIFLVPSVIACGILASSGIHIDVATVTTSNVIRSINTTQVWTEATTETNQIVLQNNVWIPFHGMLFIILSFYIFQQIMFLLTKPARQGVSEESEL